MFLQKSMSLISFKSKSSYKYSKNLFFIIILSNQNRIKYKYRMGNFVGNEWEAVKVEHMF